MILRVVAVQTCTCVVLSCKTSLWHMCIVPHGSAFEHPATILQVHGNGCIMVLSVYMLHHGA